MIAGRIVSSVAQRQIRYLTPVSASAATGLVAEVYAQVAEETGIVVPPALLHSPAPRLLAAYWILVRETLMAEGPVDRAAREAVASAVSVANTCPYCVDMHSAGMYRLSMEPEAEAIVRDRAEEAPDRRIRSVACWARSAHLVDVSPVRRMAGSPAQHATLTGVAVAMHYLNRMVNVFLPGNLVPPRLHAAARRRFKQGLSRMLGPAVSEHRVPGRSLRLLPDAELPVWAGWAADHPAVADALARCAAAFEAAGARSLHTGVRDLVSERLALWPGGEPDPDPDWCEDLVRALRPDQRAAGRLALLTAFTSYRVDDGVVGDFRRYCAEDRGLVESVAWASFAAARGVGRTPQHGRSITSR